MTASTVDTSDVTLAPLTGPDMRFFALTFPTHRALLAMDDVAVNAVGAWADGVAVGLALGRLIGDTKEAGGLTAELLSLMVAAPWRRRGIGGGLLRRLEAEFIARGALGIFAIHSSRLPSATAFERTLAKARWTGPKFKEVRLVGECGKMIAAVATWPAVQDRLLLGDSYSFTPWAETGGEADAAAIARLVEQPPCVRAPAIQPKAWEGLCDPAISIAVRRNRALVGWVAAQRLPPTGSQRADAVPHIYYISYLDLALQRGGIMISAYFRAFQRQAAAYGEASIAQYAAVEPAMMALTRRRFAPIADWIDELRFSGKRLAEPPA